MGEFIRKSAIGLTWTPDGRCWGVHLRRKRDGCTVALFWQSAAKDNESLATRLGEGFRYLGHRENAVVVVGGCGWQSSFADVDMPKLGADELRSALSFELGKRSPLPQDKLVWGYRILPGGDDQHQKVRLVYMREAEWARWIDDVSGLGQGIDVLVPPPAALDPLLKDQIVFFPEDDGEHGFLFEPGPAGGRTILRGRPGDNAFGAGPEPLKLAQLSLGGLEAKSTETKQRYMPAILLAMYGLTHALNNDKRTLLPIPYELRPKRHRYSSMVAMAVVAYLVVLAALGLGREFQAANDYYQSLLAKTEAVEEEIEDLQNDEDTSEFIQQLGNELRDANIERPSMAAALLELTRIISKDAWVTRFEWIDGTLNVTLKMQEEDLNLVQALEASPILGDVVPGRRMTSADNITLVLQMNARYDTMTELSASQARENNAVDDDAVPEQPDIEQNDEQYLEDEVEAADEADSDDTAAEVIPAPPPAPELPELPEVENE